MHNAMALIVLSQDTRPISVWTRHLLSDIFIHIYV